MALQPAQRMRAAGVDQPSDRRQVGTDVAFQDGFVVGDPIAQEADAVEVGMDGPTQDGQRHRGCVWQRQAHGPGPDRMLEPSSEQLLPEAESQFGDDLRYIPWSSGAAADIA
ncbi:hypothetical protein PGKDCPLP_03853 [Stenotrophomonas maltophilia]|nr:hypothetical protein PGKDCPLP_03853 [Stenotrophomonas maltophilia]